MLVHQDWISQQFGQLPMQKNDQSSALEAALQALQARYQLWHAANQALIGPFAEIVTSNEQLINDRVTLLTEYQQFIETQLAAFQLEQFSALRITLLEEFMYYLFRDLIFAFSKDALIGKVNCASQLYFLPASFKDMLSLPVLRVYTQSHGFAIGAKFEATLQAAGASESTKTDIALPAVYIDCYDYLTERDLQFISSYASTLKSTHPNLCYCVVTENLALERAVDLSAYKLNQIYILRKHNAFRVPNKLSEISFAAQPIQADVIVSCFYRIRNFLLSDWENEIEHIVARGEFNS